MSAPFDGNEILITGGTGSLGKTLASLLLRDHKPRGIRIFSRDELKQWHMAQQFQGQPVAFLLGDIRDRRRLLRAMERVDIVIHAAALKHVPACEENPQEAIETNVEGTRNVVECALDRGVARVMFTNTDKAVKPVNTYGATKMLAERVILQGNTYGGGRTMFSSCRYGNILASRGSFVQTVWDRLARGEPIPITDMRMTRFWVDLPTIGRFILDRTADMKGGEVFIPVMKALPVVDLVRYMARMKLHDDLLLEDVGIREGEKLHEVLIAEEEVRHTVSMPWLEPPEFFWLDGGIDLEWDEVNRAELLRMTHSGNCDRLTEDEVRRMLTEEV